MPRSAPLAFDPIFACDPAFAADPSLRPPVPSRPVFVDRAPPGRPARRIRAGFSAGRAPGLAGDATRASDAELLTALLQPGRRQNGPSARALRLLRSANGSLGAILSRDPAEQNPARLMLTRREADLLGAAQELVRRSLAETLSQRPVIDTPGAVRDFLTLWLRARPRECFVVLFLDSQNQLILAEEVFKGTLSQTTVYPREIARKSLQLCASSLILAHNHPSGKAEPSAADRSLTRALTAALQLLDLSVLDHIIVAGNRSFSFAEAGLL